MTHRAYTVTLWVSVVAAAFGVAMVAWATTIGVTAVVAAAGPALLAACAACTAWVARRELRATHVASLAAANTREDTIATR